MNIDTFLIEYKDLSNERRRSFANRLMNELTKKVNQEYNDEGNSIFFEEELLPLLSDLEAQDYFGTEGFEG